MNLLALALGLLQGDPVEDLLIRCEEAERGRKGITLPLSVVIEDLGNESRRVLGGRLSLRVSDDGARSLRIEVREERPGARPVRMERGEEGPEKFHPLEILRRGAGRWLKEHFRVSFEESRDGDLPSSVTGPDGRPVEPRRQGRRGRREASHAVAPAGRSTGEAWILLELVPTGEEARRRWPRVRIWLDSVSLSVVGLELGSPDRRELYLCERPSGGGTLGGSADVLPAGGGDP